MLRPRRPSAPCPPRTPARAHPTRPRRTRRRGRSTPRAPTALPKNHATGPLYSGARRHARHARGPAAREVVERARAQAERAGGARGRGRRREVRRGREEELERERGGRGHGGGAGGYVCPALVVRTRRPGRPAQTRAAAHDSCSGSGRRSWIGAARGLRSTVTDRLRNTAGICAQRVAGRRLQTAAVLSGQGFGTLTGLAPVRSTHGRRASSRTADRKGPALAPRTRRRRQCPESSTADPPARPPARSR